MTVKVYEVKPKTQNNQNVLDVKDGGKPIDVSQNTTIVWYLDSDNGTFNAVDGSATAGFRWPSPPGSSAGFGTPTLAPGSQVLTIVDGAGADGTFTYQLNATIGGTAYSTTCSSPGATSNNPQIKNN